MVGGGGGLYGCEGVNIVIVSVVHKQVSIAFLSSQLAVQWQRLRNCWRRSSS